MNETEQLSIPIQPIINYPRAAEVGKKYLMEIDIKQTGDFDKWNYEEEEYPIYCRVDTYCQGDTTPLFKIKTVGEPAVVLHRFGGTYGAAKFLLTAAEKEMKGEIRVTLVNGWGVPLKRLRLEDVAVVTEKQDDPVISGFKVTSQSTPPLQLFEFETEVATIEFEVVDIKALFKAINPGKPLFIDTAEIDKKYYIDFSSVRGGQIIQYLKNNITLWSLDKPTCQLFTGHIGCGKSTELLRLKQQLETEGFHVVYVESSKYLEMGDVDISDILLTIAQQVSQSLQRWEKLNLEEPAKLKSILQGAAKLLQTEIEISPEVELSFGIAKIIAYSKDSPEVRTKLREYLKPRTSGIIETINQELLEPAKDKLQQSGKKGLVVIVDDLEKVDTSPKPWGRSQPEYLFVDRGEQLMSLHCHVIYTLPLALRFSSDYATLTQNFKQDPKMLPVVTTQLRNGNDSEGMKLMRQLVLARAFPELEPEERLARVTEVFDSQETLDYLCRVIGGHVRNVLRIVNEAIMEEGELPISRAIVASLIKNYRDQRLKAIDDKEWKLLRRVMQTQEITGDYGYQTLIRSMFVYEYQDEDGSWFDVNPILKDAPELQMDG